MIRPGKIVCVGRNYREHARELGNDVPVEPLIFLKPSSSIIANDAPIVIPSISARVEHEGEIGAVVSRVLTRASLDEARSAIGAIVAINDVTARDLQKSDGQWTRAKGFDTFCPMGAPGPVGDLDDLGSLCVVTRVNGVERQRGTAAEMVFSIPMLLAFISGIMTLEPGDIVATGTPAGVGPLLPGDVVEIEIPGVSSVRNPVIAST